jgi:two-component system sensor histidine kinase MprB
VKRRPGRILGRLTLQGRFALLAAVAVSVAVIGAALASYFLVAGQLYNQVNNTLMVPLRFRGLPGSTDSRVPQAVYDACRRAQFMGGEPLMIVRSDSTKCTQSTLQIGVSATQLAVANGTQGGGVYYDTYTTNKGEHVRVYTVSAGAGWAYSSVASLSNVDASLSKLTVGLALASVGGIGVATLAGFLVARSAVRPVRRLTRAVEHVAKTEDLSVRLPITGKDEINRLGAAFNKMSKALAVSRDRQRQLIADAGHELRTPLTSLRTNVDLLLLSERTGRELPPGRRESMLVSVDQQLHELSGLVTDLLELSRGREGGARRTMAVALHESVGRAVERARLRGPGLVFNMKIEPWFVRGDPTALDRAVVNLLDNAVKFSPAAGTVTVRLSGGEYSVADQGPGIDAADLPHVFERFWRSDSARSLPGSGLGLAIVAQVAEESGGTVALEAAPGGGTLARLRIPGGPGQPAAQPTAD